MIDGPDETETLDALVEVTTETWEQSVAEHGKRAQWLPKLVLMDQTRRIDFITLVLEAPEGVLVDTGAAVLDVVGQAVQPSTTWAAITMDSYVCTDVRFNQRVAEGHTTLAELYAQGMPGVLDCLFIHAVDRGGRMVHRNLPYRVRRHEVHWLPPVELPEDGLNRMGGRMVDGLRTAMVRGTN